MREILFRGKRIDNRRWVEGHLVVCKTNGRSFITELIEVDEDSWLYWEVDPNTVGQYTGQKAAYKDINSNCLCRGQEVFEGDILSDQKGNVLSYVRFTEERGWMVGVESLYDYTDRYDDKEALIIGNIFDNPELMKGGEK